MIRDLTRLVSIIALTVTLSLMTACSGGNTVTDTVEDAVRSIDPRIRVMQSGPYEIHLLDKETARLESEGGFRIFRDRQLVLEEWGMTGSRFYISSEREDHPLRDQIGIDVTGNGVPNLVIVEYTMGNRCCLWFHVIELGEEVRKIAFVDGTYGAGAGLLTPDTPGEPWGLEITDPSFAAWKASYAESLYPTVILTYQDGEFRIDPSRMVRPPLPEDDFHARVTYWQDLQHWHEDIPPHALRHELLEWIYQGNLKQATELLDLVWPPEISGKSDFMSALLVQLTRSPHWDAIAAMQHRYE